MTKARNVLTALICVLFFFLLMTGGGAQTASAAASPYSDALEDLRKDETFDVSEYPATSGDYSLHVIQLAESEQGELLIYVYQPAARSDVQACTINIAREMDNSAGLGFKDYALEYLNNNGVFFKYRVKDFELKADAIRYYNISNILRPYDKLIDNPADYGQTITETPYAVGQFWTACTLNGSVTYTMNESEVISVTEKYVGHVQYDEGYNFGFTSTNNATAAHFVAFNTDRPIDKLKSASLSFKERDVTYQVCGNIIHSEGVNGHTYKSKFNYKYGDKRTSEPIKLTSECKVLDVGKNNYTLNRIRTTSEFISDAKGQDVKMTSGSYESVKGTKWVLNFRETDIKMKTNGTEWLPAVNILTALINGVNDIDLSYTETSDVMLLQLEFETDGKHYNLGVVDNKQTGSNKPWGGNVGTGTGCAADWSVFSALPWWAWVLICLAAIISVTLAIKLLVWLLTSPFKRREAAATSTRKPRKTKHTKGSTGKRRRKKGGKRK